MSAPAFVLADDASGGLRASGAISFANARHALGRLPALARDGAVTLDLGALDGGDSATLAVLIAWSAAARRAGASIRYRNAPRGLRNLAHLCEVEALLGFV